MRRKACRRGRFKMLDQNQDPHRPTNSYPCYLFHYRSLIDIDKRLKHGTRNEQRNAAGDGSTLRTYVEAHNLYRHTGGFGPKSRRQKQLAFEISNPSGNFFQEQGAEGADGLP